MQPFNREKFLFRLLGLIFLWQASLFTFGVIGCFNQGGLKACPGLGDRYENTVNVMVATTLALLGTTAVIGKATAGNSNAGSASGAGTGAGTDKPMGPSSPLPPARLEQKAKRQIPS